MGGGGERRWDREAHLETGVSNNSVRPQLLFLSTSILQVPVLVKMIRNSASNENSEQIFRPSIPKMQEGHLLGPQQSSVHHMINHYLLPGQEGGRTEQRLNFVERSWLCARQEQRGVITEVS